MDAFEKLPGEVEELVEEFNSQAAVGDLNAGITQYSLFMFIACAVLLVVVFAFVKKLKESPIVPKGRFVNAVEFLIDYVKSDILEGMLGDEWKKHFPFLMTVFFFVFINNVIGLIPGMHPGTGCIGGAAAIATASFLYFIYAGMQEKGVWGYIKGIAPAGVMFPINLIVWVIEIFSMFLRLATLSIRLFCNMYAGHIVMGVFAILSSLFFQPILERVTAAAFGGVAVSAAWVAVLIMIYLVEMLVAFIQAYVFTLLSTVYVQLAIEEE